MGDLQRARRHRRQHGVEIERGGDRAADFLQHLELVDRARQIPRALLDLGLQGRISFASWPAMLLNWSASSSSSSLVCTSMRWLKSPAPSRRAPARNAVDRDQHAPRQQRAGADRDDQAEPDQKRNPHQLVADRRQRLAVGCSKNTYQPSFGTELWPRSAPNGPRHRCRRPRVAGFIRGRDLRQFGELLADSGPLAELASTLPWGRPHRPRVVLPTWASPRKSVRKARSMSATVTPALKRNATPRSTWKGRALRTSTGA